ncbi:MAG TPA: hypothetical protein VND45_05160 [Thermoanaerobaculia bacterium]|jgi:hypothetical protein|nr:hypothetical protein [Thermoanaerobaculia bacterium]
MRNNRPQDRRCSYVVLVESATASAGELRELASYFSTLAVAGCDVVILDPAPRLQFELNDRVLRWVGRHIAVRAEHRGSVDVIRAASTNAACEKVIVAAEDIRYTPEAIGQLCDLLDVHEVVEPQDYLDPMPWWGGIEAGRMLIHRGIEPQPDHGATFGFRRSAIRALHALPASTDTQVRRLASVGAEVYPAADVFVRREPSPLGEWMSSRVRSAGEDFALPVKTAFFLSLVPLLLLLSYLEPRFAGVYAGVIAFVAVGLAARGRSGAAAMHFPLRACLFAPLWVLERSVSVYWALFRKLRGADEDVSRVPTPAEARARQVI